MRQTRAHIDLDALDHNLHVVRSRTHKAEVLAMVKANAYGHGLIPISRH
ncbi:MAG TPA: alanine racemase, partial [Bacteroidetes bacterium]|nr:alanine racemase [Bacteroidota bacterium]